MSVIDIFLSARKEKWLKRKLEKVTSDDEKDQIEKEANEKFSLEEWLPEAAGRAKFLAYGSHAGKFSHSKVRDISLIAEGRHTADGLIHTGNVSGVELDTFGNAREMDVYAFLSLKLSDGKTILEHIENRTPEIRRLFTIPTLSFDQIINGLLIVKRNDPPTKTNSRIKQIYFPVENNSYHLLSILIPSGILYELKSRINQLHFSDETKVARKAMKKNIPHDQNFSLIYNLCAIGYGGAQPQNISVFNSHNRGEAYLLTSMPPKIRPQTIRPPKIDFFSDSLWEKRYKGNFKELHKLFINDKKNKPLREKRDRIFGFIICKVIDQIWLIRGLGIGWSESEKYQQLPEDQKILLDQKYESLREQKDNTDWFDSFRIDLAQWIVSTYTEIIGDKDALIIGKPELIHLKSLIDGFKEDIL